ncbi:CAMK family protein kinase [Tritrichomonas foetus]|uniref:non-specific serine/threonine protein kinase n=1 Tax=Tritrichomonas foetus TaxID=1144522 RepID=A0A1J4K4R2_9EUKA|nr:CAMK family protein kinase [Tritrichomonas foetus]|eukprot:OHT05848.1 CAMK family protein kinase [Tritrichomonas foetus]
MMQGSSSLKIGNYSILYKIDSGSFAEVYMGVQDIIGQPVAIKIISKSIIKNEKDRERIQRESEIMKKISHQYIIELFEILEDEYHIYYVMELASNSLKSMILPGKPLSEERSRNIFIELTIALGYLHTELNIMHRDIKAENIMLDQKSHVRLIDFGLSNFNLPGIKNTACGSPAYAAPEVISHEKYSKSADVWSAGVLLYYMSTGYLPFMDQSLPKLLSRIMEENVDIPSHVSPNLKDLIRKLLQKDPNNRISITDILLHPWIMESSYLKNLKNIKEISETEKLKFFQSKLKSDSLEIDIIKELVNLGIDVSTLRSSIINQEFNELTAMYRIKKRIKFNIFFEGEKDSILKLFRHFSCPPSNIQKSFNIPLDSFISTIPENTNSLKMKSIMKSRSSQRKPESNRNMTTKPLLCYHARKSSLHGHILLPPLKPAIDIMKKKIPNVI